MRKLDHDEERLKIAAVAAELIAKNGAQNLTSSHVADALGATRGKVLHYFTSTQQIIDAAFDWANTRAEQRMVDLATGIEKLDLDEINLLSLLPLTEEADIEWKVRLSCWESALSDEKSNEFQKSVSVSRIVDTTLLFEMLQAEGVVRTDIAASDLAKATADIMTGLGIILLNYPLAEREERATGLKAFLNMCKA